MGKIKYTAETEPSYEGEEPASQLEIGQALNWYQANKTEKDAAKYLNCEAKIAKNHTTYAWATRMRARGFIYNDATEAVIQSLKQGYDLRIANNTSTVDVDEEGNVIVVTPVNLQERIANKTDQHIGELEGMIDEYGHGCKEFKAYDWFVKNEVKPIHANRIIQYFEQRAEQFVKEVEGKETKEGYVGLGKTKIKSILSVMSTIIKDAERLGQNINKSRKPRKKKSVSMEKQVAKLRFLEKDNNFKIQSINPVSVMGAEQVWIFNVKSRKLGVYIALDAAGLLVKGSAIVNYSEKSVSKTLRKPEKILTSVLEGGKLSLRKVMDSINSKAVPLNGRINKDTIILRAVK